MDFFKLSMAGINVSEGLKRFNGNKEMYEKYLRKFSEDHNYIDMCIAFENKEIKSAFAAAHALKGVSGNLSIQKLYNDIFPLVEELRSGNFEKAEELLPVVKDDYDDIVSVLNAE